MRVGYAHLQVSLGLAAFSPPQPAELRPVTRVEQMGDVLAIPTRMTPAAESPLSHLLFALKHEGTDLPIVMETLARIPADQLLATFQRTPNGSYIRVACYLWEVANGSLLMDGPTGAGGRWAPVFDPARYHTAPMERHSRWRVGWNGLGTPRFCATVRRTPVLDALIAADTLQRARDYVEGLDGMLLDRALAWAYLHETRDSFAIEREVPAEDRQRAFVALLHQAHAREPLSEAYLVALQQATVANPLDRAATFRHEQNWLQGPLRGSAGVTYVPPPPALARELMESLMTFANNRALQVQPLVAAAVVSFGFVFLHPFMDGNGRLSRFLIHHTLCRTGALRDGLILPVSVAIKTQEREYLRALEGFSRPARARWNVTWLDEAQYAFDYRGDRGHAFYRYWDATACVEFLLRMAEESLERGLRQEAEYLQRYDRVVRAVGERHDVRNSDLATLVVSALDNGGRVSQRRRDQFGDRVPPIVFDAIEAAAAAALAADATPHRP